MDSVAPAGDDLRVERTIRFKNRVLYDAIHSRWNSVSDAADEIGVHLQNLYALLSLRENPYYAKRYKASGPRPVAIRIAQVIGLPVSELFPPDLYSQAGHLLPRTDVLVASSCDLLPLLAASRELTDGGIGDVEDGLAASEKREAIRAALFNLTPRMQKIIELRFGLNGCEPETLEDISQRFDVGKERIRQIEARALRELRNPAVSLPLRMALDGQKRGKRK